MVSTSSFASSGRRNATDQACKNCSVALTLSVGRSVKDGKLLELVTGQPVPQPLPQPLMVEIKVSCWPSSTSSIPFLLRSNYHPMDRCKPDVFSRRRKGHEARRGLRSVEGGREVGWQRMRTKHHVRLRNCARVGDQDGGQNNRAWDRPGVGQTQDVSFSCRTEVVFVPIPGKESVPHSFPSRRQRLYRG